MVLENETEFGDISVPSTTESVVDSIHSHNVGKNLLSRAASLVHEIEDEHDDVAPSKRRRGKGVEWDWCNDDVTKDQISHLGLEAIKFDAAVSNFSKARGLPEDYSHVYVCRVKGCKYKRKYQKFERFGPFMSYYSGAHDHTDAVSADNQRGLTGEQKLIVMEAMDSNKKSCGDILGYFRSKRSKVSEESKINSFPSDPETSKLNNYVQAYKKKALKT